MNDDKPVPGIISRIVSDEGRITISLPAKQKKQEKQPTAVEPESKN